MLTATLYVDFGDRFPGGSITGVTVGDFETKALGPNIYGDSAFPFQSTDALRLDSMATIYTDKTTSIRAATMDLVRRYYQPFDITVVELKSDFQTVNGHAVRAAATLEDAAATLAINNADPKHNDAYVFVCRFVVNGENLLEKAFKNYELSLTETPRALGGVANGTDSVNRRNDHDDSAVIFLEDKPKSGPTNFSSTITHEAGHLFGLDHVYKSSTKKLEPLINVPGTTQNADILYRSELMSYTQRQLDSNYMTFMRYPTILGNDDNKDYGTLSAPSPAKSTAEQLLADPQIGKGAIEYVTGTGTHDIITISRTAPGVGTARVEAFINETFNPADAIPVPGVGGTAYTYTIDLSRPLVIDAGMGNDKVVLDGDLGTDVTVRGMGGVDSLVIMGKNAANAVYTPAATSPDGIDGETDRRGTIVIGGTTIRFQELDPGKPIAIQDVAALKIVTPNSDDSISIGDDFGRTGVFGTSGGVPFLAMSFSKVDDVVVDLAANDGGSPGDFARVFALAPEGLKTLRILGGPGADSFSADSWIGRASLTFDGGADDDSFVIGVGDLNLLTGPVAVEGGGGSADRVSVVDNGTAWQADYLVTPTSVTSTAGAKAPAGQPARGFGGLTYSGTTEFLELFATDGVNVLNVRPSVDTRYFINGNLPAPGSVPAGEGDYLKLDTKTTFPIHPDGLDTSGRRLTMTGRGAGRWDFTAGTGHEPVDFESIEQFNHVDRIAVAPEAGRTSNAVVRVHDAETMGFLFEIPAAATYGEGYRHGIRVATGDLDNDGIPDVVTAPGRMAAPVIKVFNGAPIPGTEGTEIAGLRLPAAATYGEAYRGGVNVAVGDVVGDRMNDIVVSPDRGKAIVKVFRTRFVAGDPSPSNVKTAWRSFDAFQDFPQFIGGANVATANLTGNGRSRIVVGSGSGMDGMVRVFDVRAAAPTYTASQTISGIFDRGLGGVRVAVGDIDGDCRDDLIMGSGPAGGTWLMARKGGALTTDLFQFQIAAGRGSTVPTRFVLRDVTGDGRAEVISAFGADARTGYRLVRHRNRQAVELDSLNVASAAFSGGGVNLG